MGLMVVMISESEAPPCLWRARALEYGAECELTRFLLLLVCFPEPPSDWSAFLLLPFTELAAGVVAADPDVAAAGFGWAELSP